MLSSRTVSNCNAKLGQYRVAWALVASEENNKAFGQQQSFVAGPPKNGVQLLVKDSQKYAATGDWGFFQFDDGRLPTATKIS